MNLRKPMRFLIVKNKKEKNGCVGPSRTATTFRDFVPLAMMKFSDKSRSLR